ncbi:MAG: HesA/MoeB/ThiF family protein [Syntrophaceae bacterium]|mgnify:CR=1 FL=1|nr:HesA/MoeB/ThiF family protein [Syntrophaceae bacterium]
MENSHSRYSRHTLLGVIGKSGQSRIESSRVLITGQGALGSLISILLARAGVGFLRIVDKDSPELHNLHRQILYDESDVLEGLTKVEAARRHLFRVSSELQIEAINAEINAHNVDSLVNSVDVVIDALDNTETRYIVNDSALSHGIPFIFGGAVETAGNVMTIIPGRTPCLRCLWPDPKEVSDHQRASTVGVLSSIATTVASIQVTEAIKVIVEDFDDLIPGLMTIDVWRNHYQVVPIGRDPECACAQFKSSISMPNF